MVQVAVRNLNGEVTEQIDIAEEVFGVPFKEDVVHQAVVRQLANSRQGTADTKDRAEVAGSGKKLYAQKHTGRARRGSIRSPLLRHGGIAFGPTPRSYRQRMPKKMRRLALRCALSAKALSGELVVVNDIDFEMPRTKDMVKALAALGAGTSALVVTEKPHPNVIKSARNLAGIKTVPVALLNVRDLLSYKTLIMNVAAVKAAQQLWSTTVAED